MRGLTKICGTAEVRPNTVTFLGLTPSVACSSFGAIFDKLITKLAALGANAPEKAKLSLFREAIQATNELNEQDESLIETGEREDLCELTNQVAVAAGLDPSQYGDGEGPASEWRDW